ncbi:MAG: hypothetical protein ACRBM6_29930 [Geminicoccales bacterium]
MVEAAHFQQPFDGLSFTVNRKLSSSAARDRDQPSIEVWRRSAIEPKLGFEHEVALCKRREVKKTVADRSLQFVSAITDEEYDRGMGLDPLDMLFWQAEGFTPAEEGGHLFLIVRIVGLDVHGGLSEQMI